MISDHAQQIILNTTLASEAEKRKRKSVVYGHDGKTLQRLQQTMEIRCNPKTK